MLKGFTEQEYKYGFVTNIESDTLPPGLNEDVIKFISNKKEEPKWLTDWRLKAYKIWLKMKEPHWANIEYQ
ncbi:MAG TPA: Fe-S cluster assembly protein SufB, partial [Candidatus Poseidoniia archaeon]|nr:Fe-S cluster assembly protein SufB [Candidatus Poseidoniia archaeon]